MKAVCLFIKATYSELRSQLLIDSSRSCDEAEPRLTWPALKDTVGNGVPSHPDLERSCSRANKSFNLSVTKNRAICDVNVQM